jgi:2-polyprenyl-3-methyl-5-hydroxy-6-metoxy-1,4-benzoquinol methylase
MRDHPTNGTIRMQPVPSTLSQLLAQAKAFHDELAHFKRANPSPDFTWYGYDILSNLWHIQGLLDQGYEDIFSRIGGQPIADIGAADGDLAFFFERYGFPVDVLDWPATNWNGLRGARRLAELRGSKVAIHEVDLDSQFTLPRERYGLVFLLGILYHLKNPFFVLEKLATHTRYCFVSTRIARRTVDGVLTLESAPVAYLLDPTECNNDATNYWIFSMPGLLRLADRCGWDVIAQHRVGDTHSSDPSSAENDERAFLLLRSRHCVG